MSSNHNVEIRISATNLSTAEFQAVVNDLKQMGSAADAANVQVAQSGTAARTAAGGLDSMSQSATGAVGSLRRIAETAAGVAIGNLLQDAPRLMFEFGKASFQAASDFNENMSKVEVVFGRSSEAVKQFADDAAVSFGLSESAALDAVGTFGNLFTSMGLSQQAASEMSRSIVGLAADLGSFNNIGTDQALEKIRAGLVGEIEPLRSLGVNINAVMVQQKAMSMGLADSVKELTAADKAQASYALILEQTTNAQGDFARTADGAANSMKTAQASVDDLKVAIGEGLLPSVATLAREAGETTRAVLLIAQAVRELSNSANEDDGGDGGWFGKMFPSDAMLRATPIIGQIIGINEEIQNVGAMVDQTEPKVNDLTFSFQEFARVVQQLPDTEGYFQTFAEGLNEIQAAAGTSATELERFTARQVIAQREAAAASLEYREALSTQAEAAGRANEANTDHFHTMELGSGTAADLAFRLGKLKDVSDDLAGAYQIGLKAQSDYTAQGAEYAQQQSIIEDGNEILKRQLEAGTISQEEYNREIARGEFALGRYAGGQDDATLTARDYAIQNAELMRIQDLIAGQYPDLVRGSDEYNKKVEEAALAAGISQTAIDEMRGSNSNLAGVIADELIPALQDLINKILELDGKTADVTVRTNFVTTGQPFGGGPGFTAGAESDTMGPQPQGRSLPGSGTPQGRALAGLPGVPSLDNLASGIQVAREANAAAGQYHELIVDLVEELERASAAFSGEGLEHAQLFVDTADAGFRMMLEGLDLLAAMAAAPPEYTPEIEAGIKALTELAWKVAFHTGSAAAGLDTDFLEHSQAFNDAASAGIGTLSDGLALLTEFAETDAIWTPAIEERLKGLVELAWKAAHHMGAAAAGFEEGTLPGALAFNEAASASFGTLSEALSFLSDLDETAAEALTFTADFALLFQQLAGVALLAAEEVARTSDTWREEVNPRIEAFSEDASNSLGLLGDVVGLLETLHDLEEGTLNFALDFALLFQQMGGLARMAAEEIARAGAEWDSEVNPELEGFAAAASDSLGVIGEVGDALESILQFAEEERPAELRELAVEMADTVALIVAEIERLNRDWQARGAPDIREFAEGAGAAVAVVGDAADAFEAMADGSRLSRKSVQIFSDNFQTVLELIGDLADMAEPYRDDAERFLEIVEEIAAAIGTAADLIQTVSGEASAAVSGAGGNLSTMVDTVMDWSKVGGTGGGESGGLGAAVQAIIDNALAMAREGNFGPQALDWGTDWRDSTVGLTSSGFLQSFLPVGSTQGIDGSLTVTATGEPILSTPAAINANFNAGLITAAQADAAFAALLGTVPPSLLVSGGATGAAAFEAYISQFVDIIAQNNAILAGLPWSQGALGHPEDFADFPNQSGLADLPGALGSSVGQAINDSATVQAEIIAAAVGQAVRDSIREFMQPGGFQAGVNEIIDKTITQPIFDQGGVAA